MPPPSIIEVILSMRNVGAFVGQAEEASKATASVGKSAEVAGKGARAGALGLLKYAAGAAAVYGAVRFIDHAVTSTEELAKNTYKLQVQTGMSADMASEWISATGEMGITARQSSVSFQTLSKQISKAAGGGSDAAKKIKDLRHQIDLVAATGGRDAPKQMAKLSKGIATAQAASVKARKLFDQLGVSQKDLAKGNTPEVLLKVADAFHNMRNPTTRAADAQLLFGRAGYKLLPVLSKGREGVNKWLEAQKEAGNYLTQGQVRANLKAIKQQKELGAAMHGLETQLSLVLLPVLIAIGKAFLALAGFLRPITAHANRLKVVIYGVTGAFIAWKLVTIAMTIWGKRLDYVLRLMYLQDKLVAAWTWAVTAAQRAAAIASEAWTVAVWALNAAWDANPVAIVVIGVIALGVAIYEAYKHIKVFRDAVNAAWRFIKEGAGAAYRQFKIFGDAVTATWQDIKAGAEWVWTWVRHNWPYLVGVLAGPFGLAAVLIIKHFRVIKSFVLGIVGAVRSAIRSLVNWVETLPGKLGNILKKIPGVGLALKAGGAVKGLAGHLGLQHGGTVTRSGGFLVGERGPELVSLPAGAFVRPTPDTTTSGHGRDLVITVPVVVDRRQIAMAVARVASDQLARR
jgi:hypothetical protein